MLFDTIENYEEFSIESIEPINHTLVVLLMKTKNSLKRALLLVRIRPQELSAQDEGVPRKKAKRDDESDDRNEQDGQFCNRWSYTVLDFHFTAGSSAQHCHRLATRDTLDSIVHETCTNLKFYGISNDKLIFQHEILKDNVVVQDERANEEQDENVEYDDEDYGYSYYGKFCILLAYCHSGFFVVAKALHTDFLHNFRSSCLDGHWRHVLCAKFNPSEFR